MASEIQRDTIITMKLQRNVDQWLRMAQVPDTFSQIRRMLENGALHSAAAWNNSF